MIDYLPCHQACPGGIIEPLLGANEPPLNKAALGVADLAQSSEDHKIKIVRACVRLSRACVYYFKIYTVNPLGETVLCRLVVLTSLDLLSTIDTKFTGVQK